jgi:hypothetical protein
MWTSPRPTIRAIVDSDPKRSFFWLAAIYSLQSILFMANYLSLGLTYNLAVILIIAIVLSPLIGAIFFYVYGWLFYISGRWLGGAAPASHVRAAFAWSKVPLLINLAMWFILLIFSTENIFIQYSAGPSLLFINFIALISGVWCLVLLIQSLREVQGFSIGKAIGNTLLGYALGFLLSFVLSFVFTTLLQSLHKSV